jgi:GH35 family endo-1,4-beta-xylanase
VLEEHINAVLGRYGNDLYAFDVINERKCGSRASLQQCMSQQCMSRR